MLKIKVTISNYITLHDVGPLHPAMIELLREVGQWKNPDYYRNRSLNLSNYKTPLWIKARVLKIRPDNTRDLVYERGLWKNIVTAVNAFNIMAEVKGWEQVQLCPKMQAISCPVKFPPFKLTMEDYQQSSIDKVMDPKTPFQGIISYPPGGGKTIAAAKILSLLNQRTLVLVHTAALATQWVDALTKKCFGKDISVSKVNGTKKDFSGKHVVVATVQTMKKLMSDTEKYSDQVPEVLKDFGCVILDECHHSSAPSFMEVVGKSPALRRYGLSASLKRRDGKQFLMGAVFGKVIVKLGYKDIVNRLSLPSVMKVEVPEPVTWTPENFYVYRRAKNGSIGDREIFLDYTSLFRWMSECPERNRLIENIIEECIASPTNYTLVLVKQRQHAEILYNTFKDRVPSGLLMGGGTTSYLREKDEILKKANKGEIRLIFGTSIADEGLDIARLNRLILTAPTSFDELLRQRVGRIARAIEGKTPPLVYDLVDDYIPELRSSWQAREKFYNSLEMEIFGED